MPELKPCPFCGGKASVKENICHEYQVICDKCYVSAFKSVNKEMAVKRWNRRTNNATD